MRFVKQSEMWDSNYFNLIYILKKYSQEFHYDLLNTLNDLSNEVCVPNKTEDLNLNMFNIIAGINELKTLTKLISCKCRCKFDGTKCNSNQMWNNNSCWCECKKHHICEKDYIWNPIHVVVKMLNI